MIQQCAVFQPSLQVAVQFAELHDTPTRMKEKGCLREIVPWGGARKYFYWRLRRRYTAHCTLHTAHCILHTLHTAHTAPPAAWCAV